MEILSVNHPPTHPPPFPGMYSNYHFADALGKTHFLKYQKRGYSVEVRIVNNLSFHPFFPPPKTKKVARKEEEEEEDDDDGLIEEEEEEEEKVMPGQEFWFREIMNKETQANICPYCGSLGPP